MKTKFARITAKKVTITKGQFMKTKKTALFLDGCILHIEKASIEFSCNTKRMKKTKMLENVDIEIRIKEAKIEPEKLVCSGQNGYIRSNNWALKVTADEIQIMAEKIVIKPMSV